MADNRGRTTEHRRQRVLFRRRTRPSSSTQYRFTRTIYRNENEKNQIRSHAHALRLFIFSAIPPGRRRRPLWAGGRNPKSAIERLQHPSTPTITNPEPSSYMRPYLSGFITFQSQNARVCFWPRSLHPGRQQRGVPRHNLKISAVTH